MMKISALSESLDSISSDLIDGSIPKDAKDLLSSAKLRRFELLVCKALALIPHMQCPLGLPLIHRSHLKDLTNGTQAVWISVVSNFLHSEVHFGASSEHA